MTVDSTLERIQEIFREVLDDDELELSGTTTAADVDGWDSMAHVTLMMKVERSFGVRFRVSDIAELKNVGELVDLVDRSKGAAL